MVFLISLLSPLIRVFCFLKSKLKMGNYQNYRSTDSENSKGTDAEQKYMVQIDDFLIEKLISLPKTVRYSAMSIVAANAETLDATGDEPESVGFIVTDENGVDVFLELEYFNNGEEPFFIMNIDEISSDEYLDYLNSNKTINEITDEEN